MKKATLFEIEGITTEIKTDIEKARFMANQIENDFFIYDDERKMLAEAYDTLKAMAEILFDYVIRTDEKAAELRAAIGKAFDETASEKGA